MLECALRVTSLENLAQSVAVPRDSGAAGTANTDYRTMFTASWSISSPVVTIRVAAV